MIILKISISFNREAMRSKRVWEIFDFHKKKSPDDDIRGDKDCGADGALHPGVRGEKEGSHEGVITGG